MNIETKNIILILSQIIGLLLLSPMVNSVIKKMKGLLQGRKGIPLFQGYYDLTKYFHKETVISDQTSWIFSTTPLIVFSSTLTAGLFVPMFFEIESIGMFGGVILFVYLLSLGRFFMSLAAMEPGSGFCGMASSREMMLSVLIEPVMLLSLIVLCLLSNSTQIPTIITSLVKHDLTFPSISYVLAIFALFIISIAEIGRIPFDNQETHYELTMIHEGMLLEYSGKLLGLMVWANWLKQLIIISLICNLIFPWGIINKFTLISISTGLAFYILKILIISIIITLGETVIAKVRLFRVKDILVTSFAISVLALILVIQELGRVSMP
jgi:formate hydrogenlyase subunit 4